MKHQLIQQAANLSWQLTTVSWNTKAIFQLPEKTILEELYRMKEAGLRSVMLAGYTDVEKADFNMIRGAEKICSLLKKEGFSPCQHHGIAPLFAAGAKASQKPVVQALTRSLEYTAALGSPILVLHAGRSLRHHLTADSILNDYRNQVARTSAEQIIGLCAQNLSAVLPVAQKLGVKIALENVDRFEPLSAYQTLPRLVDAVNHPYVGYCFDSGHAHAAGENLPRWIHRMGQKLLATHLHDNHGPARGQKKNIPDFIPSTGIDEHLPPGFGTINWKEVVLSLQEIEYQGTVNFETIPWNIPGPEGYLEAIRFWRQAEQFAKK